MEGVVCVLRPKPSTLYQLVYQPLLYDILLFDLNLPHKTGFIVLKQMPRKFLTYERDTGEELISYIDELTGGDSGGLKGKRAIFVPQSKAESYTETDRATKDVLYCIPIESNVKLVSSITDRLSHAPGFYSLDMVLESLSSNSMTFTIQTQIMLKRLVSWLREKYSVTGSIDLLFSSSAENRLKRAITNPSLLKHTRRMQVSRQISDDKLRMSANEIFSKMFELEKADICHLNPLIFESEGLTYRPKANYIVVNKYWGLGTPNYSSIKGLRLRDRLGPRLNMMDASWAANYPLHDSAYKGNVEMLRQLLAEGHKAYKPDSLCWTPLHYASWEGNLNVLSVLLNDAGVSPNVTNSLYCTPLHLAALNAQEFAVELLLQHPDVDLSFRNKHGDTALSLSETETTPDHQRCTLLLHKASLKKKVPCIQVMLMDGTTRTLDLVDFDNTSVLQLHPQMMRELDLPDNCSHYFTFWVCSQSLQLQLKPDHKPVEHLRSWKQKTIAQFTEQHPNQEEPKLVWRRDVILSLEAEKMVKHKMAIYLLFQEAYSNYLESLYPCSDQDVIVLGGILLQITCGDFDNKKMKKYFSSERALQNLVPASKLTNKTINWISKILAQYKHYSEIIKARERASHVLQQHFLAVCWNLKVYGSAFFTGHLQNKKGPQTVIIGVNDVGLHIINSISRQLLHTLSYNEIEWMPYKKNQPRVEIILKKDKTFITIVSKQAGLIYHLMTKISEMSNVQGPPVT